jgi:hypothetical protein
MGQGCAAKTGRTIGQPLFVDQKRERDSTLCVESPGVLQIAKTDYGQPSTFLRERPLVIAQLRNVLAAEDSTIVAKEGNHHSSARPK